MHDAPTTVRVTITPWPGDSKMKRLCALALSAVLLCGCEIVIPEETLAPTMAPTEPETQPPTEPPVIRHEAVEVTELPYSNILSAASMGPDILLLLENGMVKLDGEKLTKMAGSDLVPEGCLQISDMGLCCLLDGQMVFLDTGLRESARINLPEGMTGTPLVSADLQTIYYASGDSIRVIDRSAGRDRLLRQTTWQDLTLVKLHEAEALLECRGVDVGGQQATLFFSTETGTLSKQYNNAISLTLSGDGWFAAVSQDGYNEILVSTDGENILSLDPGHSYDAIIPLTQMQGVVIVAHGENGIGVEFCDADGIVTAAATLDAAALGSIWGNAEENCIWLLCDQTRLCRWDLEESTITDGVSRLMPRYTRDDPDVEGLAALAAQTQTRTEFLPVAIHLAEDAVAVIPDGYTAVSEYRVSKLASGVDTLMQLLEQFPGDFLEQSAKSSADKKLHIALVQSLTGSIADDTPVDAVDVQFRDDSGRIYIMVILGDSLPYGFCHGLGHVIDARVLSKCSAFDNWNSLNPKGFDYDYSYNLNAAREDEEIPEAFLNLFSMSFPTEDRATLFAHAMTGGNETRFQSEAIQKKLDALCTGIRKAFSLADNELPWEQYLQ